MLLKTYVESCKQFARDTQDWSALDQYKYYTTPGDREGWEETPGKEHGGIDVSWAFHKSTAEIEQDASQQFVDLLIDAVCCVADIDYDIVVEAVDVFSH